MTLAQPTAKSTVDTAIAELMLGDVVTLDQSEIVLESQRNAANGFLGLTGDGSIDGVVSIRQGTEAELGAIVPADGELLAILDGAGKPTSLRLGDGVTQRGNVVAGAYAIQMSEALLVPDSTTYSDIPGVVIPVVANESYEIFIRLHWAHTVDGVKFKLLRSNANIHIFDVASETFGSGSFGTYNDWTFEWPSPSAPVELRGVFKLVHLIVYGHTVAVPAGANLQLQVARVAATAAANLFVVNPVDMITVRRLK